MGKKKNLVKNFHCWFNSTTVILWIVMSVSNYYSPVLLSFFFFFKYKENCVKSQGPNILQTCIGKQKRQGSKLKFGLCPLNIGSSEKMERDTLPSFICLSSFSSSQQNQDESHSIINKWFHGNEVKICKKGVKKLSRNICLCFPGCLVSR